jgi:hypothetical protein
MKPNRDLRQVEFLPARKRLRELRGFRVLC